MKKHLMAFAIVGVMSLSNLQAQDWQQRAQALKERAVRYGQQAKEFASKHKGKIAAGVLGAAAIGAGAGVAAYAARDTRRSFEEFPPQDQQKLESNLILAVNKRDHDYLQNIFLQVRFPSQMLNSLLFLAIQGSEPKIVEILLKNGSSAHAIDGLGNSTLFWAARRSTSPGMENERAKVIIAMLLARNAPINARGQDGFTPLMFVAKQRELADMFLRAGADRSIRSDEGKVAADYAETDIMKKLLRPRVEPA